MAGITKFLARDLTAEISTQGSGDSDVSDALDDQYIEILGLNSLTHAPSTSRADTTEFDSNGRDEHLIASRGETWTLAGFTLEDVDTGERDPGQELCEAYGRIVGPAGMAYFRITSPGGNAIYFQASVEVTLHGGGTNDAAAWQVVLTVNGEPTYVPAGS